MPSPKRCKLSLHGNSFATAAYLLEKAANTAQARAFLRDLLRWATVAPASNGAANDALNLPIADLEDAMQVSAARASHCQYVITRTVKDFRASTLVRETIIFVKISECAFLQLKETDL